MEISLTPLGIDLKQECKDIPFKIIENFNPKDFTMKDLENLKGDLLQKYHTIPVIYGSLVSKKILTFLSILALLPNYLLIVKFDIGAMDFYFLGSIIALLIFVILLWKSNKKLHYLVLHNILKFIVVIGVFCIFLMNVNRISF